MSIPAADQSPEPSFQNTAPSAPTADNAMNPAADKHAGAKDLKLASWIAIAYLLFLQVVERMQGSETLIVATTLCSLLYMLSFTVYLARGLRTRTSLGIAGAVSFLAVAPSVLIPVLVGLLPKWHFWLEFRPHFIHYQRALHTVPGVDGLLMVTCAVSIGVIISRLVREFKILLPIAVVLALVDLYVVFGGGMVTQAHQGNNFSKQMMDSLTIQLPTVHPARGALPMQLALGFADYLFIALFFACFVKFGAPARRTFQVLCAAMAGVMLAVALLSIDLPALVPIALVVVGMNLRRFQYAREELFAMLWAGIIVAVVMAVLVVRGRLATPPPVSHLGATPARQAPR